jgi:hypothetical protein
MSGAASSSRRTWNASPATSSGTRRPGRRRGWSSSAGTRLRSCARSGGSPPTSPPPPRRPSGCRRSSRPRTPRRGDRSKGSPGSPLARSRPRARFFQVEEGLAANRLATGPKRADEEVQGRSRTVGGSSWAMPHPQPVEREQADRRVLGRRAGGGQHRAELVDPAPWHATGSPAGDGGRGRPRGGACAWRARRG